MGIIVAPSGRYLTGLTFAGELEIVEYAVLPLVIRNHTHYIYHNIIFILV